ncbi:hypothetical protein BCR44DRAFT_1313678 [Catenaria anguillulae PL171]|uniref:Uncharacterized protein n=1 Tax=Catenaria anguillulae PL171 TaxID=765915 RepID=A0A1Y2H708_9FUNG|nr:hypothetical protein BCR44DRAFT_1313678 [Catenaria anguillulae PL171]
MLVHICMPSTPSQSGKRMHVRGCPPKQSHHYRLQKKASIEVRIVHARPASILSLPLPFAIVAVLASLRIHAYLPASSTAPLFHNGNCSTLRVATQRLRPFSLVSSRALTAHLYHAFLSFHQSRHSCRRRGVRHF